VPIGLAAFEQLLRALDLLGIAAFAASGALVASRKQLDIVGFVLIAIVTATTGGILRDVICDELPLILRREIYLTAAAVGATVFVALEVKGVWREPAMAAGFLAAFGLRAVALLRGWSLPAYRTRPGRDYPDRG
jgi:uncharacterized membrane protein YeiH